MTKDSKEFLEELDKVIVHNEVHFNTKHRVDRLFETGIAPAFTRQHSDIDSIHYWDDGDAWFEWRKLNHELSSQSMLATHPERIAITKQMDEIYEKNTTEVRIDRDEHHCSDECGHNDRIDFPILRIERTGQSWANYRHFTTYSRIAPEGSVYYNETTGPDEAHNYYAPVPTIPEERVPEQGD